MATAATKAIIVTQLRKNDKAFVNGTGEIQLNVERYLLQVMPQDILAVLRAVAIEELNTQVGLNNRPSQILVDNMSASKRSIERAMRRVQVRFQDFTMLIQAVNEIYLTLLRVTRRQAPPKNSIVARNNFHLMIDGRLVGLLPAAILKLTPAALKMGSVVRIVGPLVNYGRRLFWNPVGASAKMKYRRIKTSRGTGTRFLPLKGASKLSPQFRPYAPRTLRKLANRSANPAALLQALYSGSAPPGRMENAGQIVKRTIARRPAYHGLHFSDGWIEYAPAVGWSKLGNARVPAFGVMFTRKGQVKGL